MRKIEGQGRYALMVQVLLGCIIFGFSRSTVMPISLVLIFFSGAAMMISMSMVSSLVQAVASDEMRGRVMSVYNVAFRGGMPVGSIVLGRLIPVFSAPTTTSGTKKRIFRLPAGSRLTTGLHERPRRERPG